MAKRIAGWLLQLLGFVSIPVFAQALPEYSMRGADRARDLELPTVVSSISENSVPGMALY